MPGIAEVNGLHEPDGPPPAGLVLAHDVPGGVFALNGPQPRSHGRPGRPDDVVCFCPGTLTWPTTEMDHDRWLNWIVNGGAAGRYRDVL